MHPCEQQGHDVKHTAVRIPWSPSAAIQVEHECQTWGCPNRLNAWQEEAQDPEGALLHVFGRRGELGPDSHAEWMEKERLKAAGHSTIYLPCATGTCGHVPPQGHYRKPIKIRKGEGATVPDEEPEPYQPGPDPRGYDG